METIAPVRIEIESNNIPGIHALTGDVPIGVAVDVMPAAITRHMETGSETEKATLSIIPGAAASLIAAWIYEKLRDKKLGPVIIINGSSIDFNQSEIERMIAGQLSV